MKSEHLLTIIGEIDERYIAEAIPEEKKRPGWVKWAAVAACLCFVLFGALIAYKNGFISGLTGGAAFEEPEEYNQLVLVNHALNNGYPEQINTQFVNTQQGLCLPDDSEAPNGVWEKNIAAYVAPDEFSQHDPLEMSLDEAKEYAYLDYDSATDEMKERILEARRAIIFHSNWVADGYSGYITNVKTGEIIETLPSFSTLFPDWDIPHYSNEQDRITADGLGADCLYGLHVSVVKIDESVVICEVQEQVYLFEKGQIITVYPPENSSIDMLDLEVGDLLFLSYWGKNCDGSNRTIKAEAIEAK